MPARRSGMWVRTVLELPAACSSTEVKRSSSEP
jgi:hypothetical protein